MFLVIGQVEIEELEKIVFREFPRFRNLFRQKHGSDIFDTENYQHIDPIWTCFINGKGKGYQIDNWKGVFKIWKESFEKEGIESTTVPESWYHVDMAVIDYSHGGWLDGKYKIKVLFQQENNPKEIAGHLREYYDFTAPNKILLIWTNKANPDPRKIMDQADEIVKFCTANGIQNVGRIVIVVGDWEHTKSSLRHMQIPTESVFITKIIDSSPNSLIKNEHK